jgi:RHS repeat-associated protein
VVVRDDGTPYCLLNDHLGSTAITVNGEGTAEVGELRYYPYGETRYNDGSTPTSYRFTGQRQDATGLYFYNARYYDATLGRFVQADTIVPGAADGAGGGAATLGYSEQTRLTSLTVGFHEAQFLSVLNAENQELLQFGPVALWDSKVRQEHTVPMGPANPQALNRYSYCLGNPLRYTDPDGHFAFLIPLVTGLIGGVAGGAGSLIAQMAQGEGTLSERWEDVDWGNVGIATGVGFVAGALAPLIVTPLGAIALGADATVSQYALTQWSNDETITAEGTAINLAAGGLSGLVVGPCPQPDPSKLMFKETSGWLDTSVAEAVNTGIRLGPIVGGANLSRSALGGIVSNWDWTQQWDDLVDEHQ